MKRIAAACLCLSLATAAQAAGPCTLSNGFYVQHGTMWELSFTEVPRDAAANQTHAFSLRDGSGTMVLDGGIYAPNGFSQALGIVDRAVCTPPEAGSEDAPDACQLWQGPVYMNSEAGIDWIADRSVAAPRQILLPGFGSAWWYSDLRDPDNVPLDVFTLRGCSP